jgi:hypothetical protein
VWTGGKILGNEIGANVPMGQAIFFKNLFDAEKTVWIDRFFQMLTICHADFPPLKIEFIISKYWYFVNKFALLRHITRLISLGYFGVILVESL